VTLKEALSQAKERVSALEGNLNRLREARKAWEKWMDADDLLKTANDNCANAIANLENAKGGITSELQAMRRDINGALETLMAEQQKYPLNSPEREAIRAKLQVFDNAEFHIWKVIDSVEQEPHVLKMNTQKLAESMDKVVRAVKPNQKVKDYFKSIQDFSYANNELTKAKGIKEGADGAWQKFENQGLDPNPANISRLENELSAERGNFNAATNELQQISEARQSARSERNALKTDVEAEKADLQAKQSELEAYERNAVETERRFEKADVEAADADHKRFMKEAELRDTKYWKTQADEDLKRLEAEEGYPASGEIPSGGEGPSLAEQLKPGIVTGVEQMLGKLGEMEQKAFGTQSPDEIAAILRQCRDAMERDLAEFQAKQAALDAARQLMQSLKPALDKCVEENSFFQ